MTNPAQALYESILEDFAAKPTRFSAVEDLADMEAALARLSESPIAELVRSHAYNNLPTFLYELRGLETWILIDKINSRRCKIVVRSNRSIETVADALSLTTALSLGEVTWGDLEAADLFNYEVDAYDEDEPF